MSILDTGEIIIPGHDGPVKRKKSEIILPKHIGKFDSPKDFKEKKRKMEHFKRLDIQDYGNVSDMTAMIDFHNQTIEDDAEKRLDRDAHEIAMALVKSMFTKTIWLGAPKKD